MDGGWNGTKIRELRKKHNLTQRDFAEKLGCRQQTVSEWELALYLPKNAYQKLISLLEEKLNANAQVCSSDHQG